MRPSLWDDDVSGSGSGADILEEERERRLRRRRGLRRFTPGAWLTGRFGVFLLLAFLVGGVGWFGFSQWEDSSRLPPGPGSRITTPLPERGRDLTSREYSLASRYGRPLYLSLGGAPVVRVEGTGQVRELTPFELEFDSAFTQTGSSRGRVIGVTGPRGWGMWWRDMSEVGSLRPMVSFDRFSWAERQERELARMVRGVSLGVRVISEIDLELWDPGLGGPFVDLMSQVREPYPPARHGLWSAVPGLWVCDSSLERELHQGLTPGCPGEEYMEALRGVWSDAGLAVDRMEGIARLMERIDGMSSEEIFQSDIRSNLSYEIMDLDRNLRVLDDSLVRLRRVSRDWDLSLVVQFMEGG